jgi:hypothetical protein
MSGAIRGRALLAVAVSVVVVVAVIAGFMVTGTPDEARRRSLDQRRIEHLQAIQRAVDAYYHDERRLPASLDSLRDRDESGLVLVDPVIRRPYGYRVISEREYELCATYEFAYGDEGDSYPGRAWHHPAGAHCHRKKAPRLD